MPAEPGLAPAGLPPVFVSPPFGNARALALALPRAALVRGTYTLRPRPGLYGRLLRTLRPAPGGWINKVGLRNPGVTQARPAAWPHPRRVYSLAAFLPSEWLSMACFFPLGTLLELNVGCPNAPTCDVDYSTLSLLCREWRVGLKLPPAPASLELARMAEQAGAAYLHFCNTFRTPAGGLSGALLRNLSLRLTEQAAGSLSTPVVGGGGIYRREHVRQYRDAGARHFSVSTIFITAPHRLPGVYREACRSTG